MGTARTLNTPQLSPVKKRYAKISISNVLTDYIYVLKYDLLIQDTYTYEARLFAHMKVVSVESLYITIERVYS